MKSHLRNKLNLASKCGASIRVLQIKQKALTILWRSKIIRETFESSSPLTALNKNLPCNNKDDYSIHLHETNPLQSTKDRLRFYFLWQEASHSSIHSCIVKEKVTIGNITTKARSKKLRKFFSLRYLFSSKENFIPFSWDLLVWVIEHIFTYHTFDVFYDSDGTNWSAPKNSIISSLPNSPLHS